MFKKFVSVCLAMLVMVSQVPTGVFAEEAAETSVETADTAIETDWSYEANKNGGITLTEYKGNETEVVIPETIDGFEVKSFAGTTFENTTGIASLTFPSTIDFVCDRESGRHYGLDKLDSLECLKISANHPDFADFGGILYTKDFEDIVCIPPMIKEVEFYPGYYNMNYQKLSFKKCKQLAVVTIPEKFWYRSGYPTFPDNVIIKGSAGTSAERLAKAYGLKFEIYDFEQNADGDFISGDLVLSINEFGTAFSVIGFAAGVEHVVVPEEVYGLPIEFVGDYFDTSAGKHSSLKSVEIPKTVTGIGFKGHTELVDIGEISENVTSIVLSDLAIEAYTVNEANPYFTSIDGVIYNKDLTELIAVPTPKTELIMPKTVTSVGSESDIINIFDTCNLKYIELSPALKMTDSWWGSFANATVFIPKGYSIDNTVPGSIFSTVYIVEKGSEWKEKLIEDEGDPFSTVMITYEENPDGKLVFDDYSTELDTSVLEISDITDTEVIFSRKDLPCDTAGGVEVTYDIYVNDILEATYKDNGEDFNYSYPLEFNKYYNIDIVRTLNIEAFNFTKKTSEKYQFDTLRLSEIEGTFTEQTLEEDFASIYQIIETFASTRNLISFEYAGALGYALKDGDNKTLSIYKVGSNNVITINYDNKDVAKILFEEGFLFVCYLNAASYTVIKYTENGEIVAKNDFTVTPNSFNNDVVYTAGGTVFFYSGDSLVIQNERAMGGSTTDGGVVLKSASAGASYLKISPDTLVLTDEHSLSYVSGVDDLYFRLDSTFSLSVTGELMGVSNIESGMYSFAYFYDFSEDFTTERQGKITHYYTDEVGRSNSTCYATGSAVSPTGVFCSVGRATKSLSYISGFTTQNVYVQLSYADGDIEDKNSYVVGTERSGNQNGRDVTDYGMIWLTDVKENYEGVSTARVVYYKGTFVVFYEIGNLGKDLRGYTPSGEIEYKGALHNFKTYYQVLDLNGNVIKGETLLGEGAMFGQFSDNEELPIFVTEQGIQWIGNKIQGVVRDVGYDPELALGGYDVSAEKELTLYTLSFKDLMQDTTKNQESLYGDCTEDGFVNIADLVYIHKVFQYGRAYVKSCDLDGDGVLSIVDYSYMKRTLFKKVYAGETI